MQLKICLLFLTASFAFAQITPGGTPATGAGSTAPVAAPSGTAPQPPPQDAAHLAAVFQCEVGDSSDNICKEVTPNIVENYFKNPDKNIGAITALARSLASTEKDVHVLVHLVTWKGDKLGGEVWLACGAGRSTFAWNRTFSCDTNRYVPGARRIRVLFLYGNVTDAAAPFARNAHYYLADTPKEALWLQHLKALLALAGAQSEDLRQQPKTLVGYGPSRKVSNPSDITVAGVAENDALPEPRKIGEIGLFDNEGRSFADFTVAVPINKVSVVQYDQKDGVFLPKEVNKQSVYAAANLYPWPVFLGHGSSRFLVPRAIVGIGLTGRPGSAFLVGGSWGVSWLQVFAGSAFVAHDVKSNNPSDAISRQRYSSRLTYGLNIPVLKAASKLVGKAKDGGSK